MHINVIGRLGKLPEKRQGAKGEFVSFDIAVKSRFKNEDVTDWFNVTSSNQNYFNIFPYLKVGSQVNVTGTLQHPTWFQAKDGSIKSDLKIFGEGITFVSSGKKKTDDNSSSVSEDNQGNQDSAVQEENQDDLPF